ncbi:5-methylcytosine-specific restriction endonuclease system specificity protein McrC [Mucilaginibacter pocheonensis]|uniref:5-methylcytosine-specific restriction enzyme subunit McrC n=1 Tax=Mucilaginibacter pocheonensis TaxID=398050 RepID=A0ABU1T7X5_9SPHI|nr:5-methylcytosine-specific restriction endonuclease system specificity protein McrC [Mucilaginibacter pocheonensis]MDR6941389.1 5-methylcytosine-specific restriction enzyme subunit McrC [Mucilaginibacter pocheonensis]
MSIPIKNIYFLLCYAWNKLDEKDRVDVTIEDYTELIDLFAKVLINATRILLKRGIDKHYVDHTAEVNGIKGKLEISQTLKKNLLFRQKTICTYSDFSSNILLNQILFTTVYRLVRTRGLDKQLKNELIGLQRMFPQVDLIALKPSVFQQVRITRNNRFYGFIMNVCQLIYDQTFPSEEKGSYKFVDFTRDPARMNQLFEAFIRNFYKIEQQKYTTVKREAIKWQLSAENEANWRYLPIMETDITLENETEKVIIDAKYYKETMSINYGKEKINSGNLYQLFSYLINQRTSAAKTIKACGILIYPTIATDYDLRFNYQSHPIYIKTLNLNKDWKEISLRLKEIIGLTVVVN